MEPAQMSFAHIIFIPGVLLIGVVMGYLMGIRAARTDAARRRARMRE
jgi:hypothetical protein